MLLSCCDGAHRGLVIGDKNDANKNTLKFEVALVKKTSDDIQKLLLDGLVLSKKSVNGPQESCEQQTRTP